MSPDVRALVRVSAALAAEDRTILSRALDAARRLCTPTQVEETLLQSYLFLGYPAALNALALWREQSGMAAASTPAEDPATWRARGEAVCAQVYAGQYERLRANIARLHPEVEDWMLTEGYGKVLGRPGLALAARELCIVALLVSLDAAPQLYAHLRGALNAGAAAADVELAVNEAAELAPASRAAAAREVWRSVKTRREEQPG